MAVQLSRDDVMVVYADGITDATDAAGNVLGGDRLMEIVRNLPVESPVAMADLLIAAMRNFHGNAPRDDDQSFFILRQREG